MRDSTGIALENEKSRDRYFLFREPDGSWSIVDRHIVESEREHRLIVGLDEQQGTELVEKLNSLPA